MRKNKKIVFVILGATGDLSTGKIFPALAELHRKNSDSVACALRSDYALQNQNFSVVAVSRRPWSDDDFRDFLGREKYGKEFLSRVFYKTVFFDSCLGSPELKKFLKTFGNAKFIFYVSVAPTLYETALRCMKKNRLLEVGDPKILIEKPFGLDLKSAKKLNALATSFLEHKQIYRVDHYLGKSALRALTEIHEKSRTFSDIVSNKTVESISVWISEDFGVKDRGTSYDGVGAFRDVGQNHILQMLSAVALTPPRTLSATAWHSARANVVESLETKKIKIYRGQYRGYTDEKNVAKDSKTETFFSIESYFNKGKLKGVPVTLQSGKKLAKREASIEIEFKNGETLDIPVEGEAYGRILEAAAEDRRELFVGGKEIFAAWKFVDTVLPRLKKAKLEIY